MSKITKAIPEGYHTVTPYLSVKGAERAIDFYKKAFGAQEIERHAGAEGKIMHAVIKIGDSLVMLADEFPESGCGMCSPESLKGSSVLLNLYVEDVDTFFNQAVKAGSTVIRPLMDAFWGDRYGQLRDPFGHLWSVATRKKNLTPEQFKEAAEEWMKNSEWGNTCDSKSTTCKH